jgi:polyisoprenoid-binding protein YceI
LRSSRLRLGLTAGAAVAALALVLVGVAVLLIRAHTAPAPLALTSPAAASTPGGVEGTWKVTSGSEAGYRAREKFINQPEPTEAVARTSHVTGGLVIATSGSSLRITGIHFTVDLSTLQSQDKYAMYQAYQRDFFVKTIYLNSDTMPNAVFKGDPVTVPTSTEAGPVTLTFTGTLMLHGVTKQVTSPVQVQMNGSQIEAVGSTSVDMRDFGIEVPVIGFTTAEPIVTIEYHLLLTHA